MPDLNAVDYEDIESNTKIVFVLFVIVNQQM